MEYNELKKQLDELQLLIEQERKNPTSEYDESIHKQQYFNETLRAQVKLYTFFLLPHRICETIINITFCVWNLHLHACVSS